jgi:hypothetical protein
MKKFEVCANGLFSLFVDKVEAENKEIANGKVLELLGCEPNQLGGYSLTFENLKLPNGVVLDELSLSFKSFVKKDIVNDLKECFITDEIDENGELKL